MDYETDKLCITKGKQNSASSPVKTVGYDKWTVVMTKEWIRKQKGEGGGHKFSVYAIIYPYRFDNNCTVVVFNV